MDKLETYNRVPVLESQFVKRFLILCYLLNLIAAIACIFSYWVIRQPWPYALLGVGCTIVVSLLLLNYDSHRPKKCRYCHSKLEFVVRPLVLNSDYLTLEGRKVGNYFYTRDKKGIAGANRWLKLSNQALVCHHCRLTEATHRIIPEPVSGEEKQRLNLA